jgi:hypothetical protein
MRLAGIGLLAAAVAVALYVVGRVHTVNPAFSLFGRQYICRDRAEGGAGDRGARPGRAAGAAGSVDLPEAAAGGQPAASGAAGAPVVGFGLFALTLPVAVHCLIAYGVQLTSVRVAVHSLAGCFFYGAFVAKVLLVQTRRLPGWVLPAAGGTLAVVVTVLWYTPALWYYNGYQLPHI